MYVIKSSHSLHLGGNASEPHVFQQKHLCSPWACACSLWRVVCFCHESDACFYSCRAEAYGIWFLKALPIFIFYICDFFHTLKSQYFILFFSSSPWFVWVWEERAGCRVINFQASWCHRWQAWILRRVLLVLRTINYSVLAPPKPFQGIASTRNMLASRFLALGFKTVSRTLCPLFRLMCRWRAQSRIIVWAETQLLWYEISGKS